MSGLVDWPLAERAASAVIAGLPGGTAPTAVDGYTGAEIELACERAIETASVYAGLGPVAEPPTAELIDRRAWARTALATLAEAATPLEARVAAELDLPGPLGPLARRTVGAAVGAEAGLAAGYVARRVLGQYDVAIFGPVRPPRLLFVSENMEAARSALDAERGLFLRWVALHETTHVIQFDRVEWLAGHLRELARTLIEGATEGIGAAELAAVARRLLGDPRDLVRALLRDGLSRTLADPERQALLDRLQATMSVIEGHAEHVMDACVADHGPELDELRRRLQRRRERRGGLGELIARLLGMDLKLRQYEAGKAFCDAVVAEAGAEGLRAMWRSPSNLPDLDELEAPAAWVQRVVPVPV